MSFDAGRFVLLFSGDGEEWGYCTSWDTWEEAAVAFCCCGRIPNNFRLTDDATGRVWHAGAPYEWEAAQT